MLKADGPELQRYREEVKTRLEARRAENPDSRKMLMLWYAMTGGEQNALTNRFLAPSESTDVQVLK